MLIPRWLWVPPARRLTPRYERMHIILVTLSGIVVYGWALRDVLTGPPSLSGRDAVAAVARVTGAFILMWLVFIGFARWLYRHWRRLASLE